MTTKTKRKISRASATAFAIVLAALSGLAISGGESRADTVNDRIVAKVNRGIITLSELQARLKTLSPEQKAALSSTGNPERQLLEMMVEEELVREAASKMGIGVSEAEVDEAVEGILKENNINMTQLRKSLEAGGTTLETFRSQYKIELLRQKIVGYNFMGKTVVTDQEVNDFLSGKIPATASQAVSATGVSDFHGVRIIFLRSSPREVQKVIERAAKIKEEIENGLPFAEAARRHSEGPGADNGGDPGNLVVRDLQPELQQLARNLTPGEVSIPLNGGDVVLLITVMPLEAPPPEEPSRGRRGKKEEKTWTPEQKAGARRQLEQMKLRSKYETWMAELKNTAVIKITL
ncbi:MAG: SurA N-terminal domain-containing protein [Deltaproteobacteria bacterium]|jgi:peptidyl-prolyl cis-trans isomerase SurA|nr:SurA N-terminal domain-containing protein [Deltaproteobacteria bacterium]